MSEPQERILLVDDEPNVLSGYRRQLGRRYAVVTALGGAEALQILADDPAIAVIVADMRMPRMSGVQLLAEAEKHRPDVVRMMLTGNVDQDTAVQAVNRGHVFRFINKPAPAETVAEAIDAALGQSRLIRAERELVRQADLTAKALERERIAAKQQRDFIGMVSHEFRTPLAIIDSAVEILGGPYQITEQQKAKRIKMIRDSVRRMTDLMESVLSVARLEGGRLGLRPETVDVAALLTEIAERVEASQSTHRVVLEFAPDLAPIRADPKMLEHVFNNLIGNAVKYSPGKTRVLVRCAADPDGGVSAAVADEGVGIPNDELERIFDRYYRASTAGGVSGAGIGLFIANEFVRLHGGRIEVAGAPGRGTVFTVRLPAAPPAEKANAVS